MKKALKILACLLIVMTAVLGTNVSKANAQICDKSANPWCFETLNPGESTEIPLPGYQLQAVELEFSGGPIPQIFPPPTVHYELESGFTQVSGELDPTITSRYKFNPEMSRPAQVRNVESSTFALPLTVRWKNIRPFE